MSYLVRACIKSAAILLPVLALALLAHRYMRKHSTLTSPATTPLSLHMFLDEDFLLLNASLGRSYLSGSWANVRMPSKSHFRGCAAPSNATRWKLAVAQAASGEQVLLRRVMQAVGSPLELLAHDPDFKWMQGLADLSIGKDESIHKADSEDTRARVIMLGRRRYEFESFERDVSTYAGEVIGDERVTPAELQHKLYGDQGEGLGGNAVLIGLMDQHQGWLSSPFPNRTAHGSPPSDVTRLLSDPQLLMLIVNQHHNHSHPKLLSVPLGVRDARLLWSVLSLARRVEASKTSLAFAVQSNTSLMGNVSRCMDRRIRVSLLANAGLKQIYLQTALAKVVLAVPEEGYDTSLVVEALALGALVVLERGAGLERALHALPVLLVDDFGEVTAALLKEAYAEALYHAEHWDFRRITKQWYEGLIFAVAEDSSTGPLLALHPVDRDDTLFRRPSVHFDCRAIGGCGSGTARVPRRRRCLGPRT